MVKCCICFGLCLLVLLNSTFAFRVALPFQKSSVVLNATGKTDNKAMQFLKKIGRTGKKTDFTHAIGVDEGTCGKTTGSGAHSMQKSRESFPSCIASGLIDNMQEIFPTTSCGTQWSGFTDQVMGGSSMANLCRETFDGRVSNVLRGEVSLANNGGFIQMATDLEFEQATVDASQYSGLELDVQCTSKSGCEEESFNLQQVVCVFMCPLVYAHDCFLVDHSLKTDACTKPFSSYRSTFNVPCGSWNTVRLPFSAFLGKGPGAETTALNVAKLRRLGIVAIGREMKVLLAVSGVRFYANAH